MSSNGTFLRSDPANIDIPAVRLKEFFFGFVEKEFLDLVSKQHWVKWDQWRPGSQLFFNLLLPFVVSKACVCIGISTRSGSLPFSLKGGLGASPVVPKS